MVEIFPCILGSRGDQKGSLSIRELAEAILPGIITPLYTLKDGIEDRSEEVDSASLEQSPIKRLCQRPPNGIFK